MNWKTAKVQIGWGGDETYFLHFTDDAGEDLFLTVEGMSHVLIKKPNAPSQYGDDLSARAAFHMLTGIPAEEVEDLNDCINGRGAYSRNARRGGS